MDHSDSVNRLNPGVRVRLFQSDGSDDPEDTGIRSLAQGGIDYDNDDNSTDEQDLVLSSCESGQIVTAVSQSSPLDIRGPHPSADGDDSISASVVRPQLLDDEVAAGSDVDEDEGAEDVVESSDGVFVGRRLSSPAEGFGDERDPNYAVQRPDTLGAINIADPVQPGVIAAGRPHFPAPARFWSADSAAEGSSFADDPGALLGRRTRGAGMDQVELNQRQQLPSDSEDDDGDEVSDGEGSELCEEDDNGLQDANQCESTEADQYKMDPEADQSDGSHTAAVAGCMVAGGNRYGVDLVPLPANVRHNDRNVVQRPPERESSRATSEEIHDTDQAEDDQAEMLVYSQVSASSARVAPLDVNLNIPHSGGMLHQDGRKRVPVSLPQHPQSAFSLPKPREIQSQTAKSLVPGEADAIQSRQGQLKVNIDTVFKPICTSLSSSGATRPEPLASVAGSNLAEDVCKYSRSGSLNILPSQAGKESSFHPHSDHVSNTGRKLDAIYEPSGHFCINSDGMPSSSTNGLVTQNHHPLHLADGKMLLAGTQPYPVNNHTDVFLEAPVNSAGNSTLHGGNEVIPPVRNHHSGIGAFVPHDSSSQQTTPMKSLTRPYHLTDDSLEMSPIQPASSAGSRPLSLDPSSGRGIFPQTDLCFGLPHHYSHKVPTTSEVTSSEIHNMEVVRGQLHQLLMMSDRNLPGKASYDQTNDDVDDLLTSRPSGRLPDSLSYWSNFSGAHGLSALQEALPLSSKYLVSSSSASVASGQHRPDVATLLAENRALQDAMEQQRFKLKHCEKQIQQLQGKVLELQQDLAVAVSTDHKKDIMIEQLDKALYKVVEGWRQKESERQEVLQQLQLDKSALQQSLDSQLQVVGRFEKQLKQTLQELHAEQQRTTNVCHEKDRQIAEQQSECERIQHELDREREQCRRMIEAERCDAAAGKSKLQAQIAHLKSTYQEEQKAWEAKERHYLQKMDEMTDNHVEMMEQQKRQLEKQQQIYAEQQLVVRTTQMQVEKLQLELDTVVRERESLKVELSLAEARIDSNKRKLEAELQMQAERQLATRLDEAAQHQAETERKIHETHRCHLQELAQQHHKELERLGEEHQEALRWLDEKHRQDVQQYDDRIKELENEVVGLEEENKRMQIRNVEMTSQLQNMMQSHCSEALRLLQLASISAPNMSSSEMLVYSNGKDERHLPVNKGSSSLQPVDESVQDSIGYNAVFQSPLDDESHRLPSLNSGDQPAAASASATNQLSAQYSQFLASVRGFKPMLADLNASITSVANSVSTLDATSRPASDLVAGRHHVGDIWLHSPVLAQSLDVPNSDCQHDSLRPERSFSGGAGVNVTASPGVNSNQNGSLFHHILKHDVSANNTSDDSVSSEQRLPCNGLNTNDRFTTERPCTDPDKLFQQEQRHKELHHYIRVLLQRSPATHMDSQPIADRSPNPGQDVDGRLTPSQVAQITKMIERHQQASARNAVPPDSDQLDGLLAYLKSTQSSTLPTNQAPSTRSLNSVSPLSDLGRPDREDTCTVQVRSGADVTRMASKPCRQGLTSDHSIGPGRPDVISDHGRQCRSTKQELSAKASRSSVPVNGIVSKRVDRKQIQMNVKNQAKQPSAWK